VEDPPRDAAPQPPSVAEQLGGLRHLVSAELQALPELLAPGEQALWIGLGASSERRGLLVVSDRRILLVEKHSDRGQLADAYPYGELSDAAVDQRGATPTLTLVTLERRLTLTIVPGESAAALAGALRGRLGSRLTHLPRRGAAGAPERGPSSWVDAASPWRAGASSPSGGSRPRGAAPARIEAPLPLSPGSLLTAETRDEPSRYAVSDGSAECGWLLLTHNQAACRVATATRECDLWVTGRGSWTGVAALRGSGEALAAYYPGVLWDGTLVFDDERYRVREKRLSGEWQLRHGHDVLARLCYEKGNWAVSPVSHTWPMSIEIGTRAQEVRYGDLLVMLFIWSVGLEVSISGNPAAIG
jgi:hypothetical protein